MILQDILNEWSSNVGGDTPTTYIKTEFNKLTNLGVEEMTDNEAGGLYYVLENRLTKLLPCSTIYDDTEEGITGIKRILKYNLYTFVIEIRNMVKAISKDIATSHNRAKFNPLDNTDIDNAADESDLQSFSYVNNMITQVDYLNENSRTLGKIYKDFASICYIVGVSGAAVSSGTSGDYVTHTEFNTAVNKITDEVTNIYTELNATEESLVEEVNRAKAREDEIEALIPSTESFATKAELNEEATRATSEEGRLEGLIDSLDATKAGIDYVNEQLAGKQPTINKYADAATVSNNTLTINFSNGDTTSFTPTSQEGGITDVQVTDTSGTASVVTSGVANIDLTGYMTTSDANSKFEQVANKVTSLDSGATDTEYPSAKCVYDLVGNVETILQTLNTGTGAK